MTTIFDHRITPEQLHDAFIHLAGDVEHPLFTIISERKHPTTNHREPNRDFDTHIDVRNP